MKNHFYFVRLMVTILSLFYQRVLYLILLTLKHALIININNTYNMFIVVAIIVLLHSRYEIKKSISTLGFVIT